MHGDNVMASSGALVAGDSTVFMFGPVFSPAGTSKNRPCWSCLHSRFREAEQARAAEMRELTGMATSVRRSNFFAEQIIGNRLQMGLAAWLVDAKSAALSGHIVAIASPYENCTYHWVKQLPQCAVCGDRELLNSQRQPTVPQLRSLASTQLTSGGMRRVPPQQVVAQYQRHVSALTGVIEKLDLVRGSYTDAYGQLCNWYFTTLTGSNRALQQKYIKELKGGVRYASSGKGDTAVQAQASGICESD